MHTFDDFFRVFVKGLLSIDIDTILFRDKLCLFYLGIIGLTNDEFITINGNFWILSHLISNVHVTPFYHIIRKVE